MSLFFKSHTSKPADSHATPDLGPVAGNANALVPFGLHGTSYLPGPNGKIAYRQHSGKGTGLVWLGGFRSDMLGSKADYIDQWARQHDHSFLRFDYAGHGQSDGKFREGSISHWAADASHAVARLTQGPQILIGSSMGGWIAMLLAQRHPANIAALILIAPAPDFTEALMWAGMDDATREQLMTRGHLERPSAYSDEPEIITRALIEDGRNNLVLNKTIKVNGPVRILQGMADPDVPWEHARQAVDCLSSDDISITLVKGGDHRLSTDTDLMRLGETLSEVTAKVHRAHN